MPKKTPKQHLQHEKQRNNGNVSFKKSPSKGNYKRKQKRSHVKSQNVLGNHQSSNSNSDSDEIILVSDASEENSEFDFESSNEIKSKNEKPAKSDTDNAINNMNDNDDDDDEDDEDDEVIILDDSDSSDEDNDEPPLKKQKTETHKPLDTDLDFIAFDQASDSDSADDMEGYDPNPAGYDNDNDAYLSNDESSYKPLSKPISTSDFPWIRNTNHSTKKSMPDWLSNEIFDFVKYISPCASEIRARNELIQNLRNHISNIWPDAELLCFGSFATDLYLPGSDIDCVIVTKSGRPKYDTKNALYKLTSYIRNNGLGIEVVPIAKAKVPIIKFVDPKTKIHIDISFERKNGLTAAKLINEWLESTPGLRELVLIIKQFLASRRLNEVHTGGLGGFAIICLVYTFLHLHPRLVTNHIDPIENIGILLIEFFELYGYNFGYDNVAIAFSTPSTNDSNHLPLPYLIPKSTNPSLLNRSVFALSIQDPHDPLNNITRGSFNLRDIKRAFGGAYDILTNQCFELESSSYKERLGKSILGGIIKWKGRRRSWGDARNEVNNLAKSEVTESPTPEEYDRKKEKRKRKKEKRLKKEEKKKRATPPKLGENGLPLLPSEKAGINYDEVDFTTITDSDDDDNNNDNNNNNTILEQFEKSQQPKIKSGVVPLPKPKSTGVLAKPLIRTTDKNELELLGINTDDDDDEDHSYEPDRPTSAVAMKEKRRDYWTKKGMSF